MEMRIPLSAPEITEADIEAVVNVLRTPRLSIGPRMVEFEQAMAEAAGVPYGIAVSSGTAGLHLCLSALGIGEGDEVILPSFTFIAAGNVVLYQRATPVFVDIDPITLNLNPDRLEKAITPRTGAIIVVHTFGHPADLGPILDVARKHGVPVIEDACEAIGAQYRGRTVGGIGDFGVFGFYPNKPITTGEGGMVVTRDAGLADTMRALRNQGRMTTDGWLDHSLLGYNYRLSEMNCALGVAQMKRLGEILEGRESVAIRYANALQEISEVTLPPLKIEGGRLCWFVFVIRLAAQFAREDRDSICEQLTAQGIGCGRYFAPLHKQPLFAAYANPLDDLAITEQVADRTLALPFFNGLTDAQITEVCGSLRDAIRGIPECSPQAASAAAGPKT
ncbi:MAG: DegT/DnrJ/EryC1/StrS family aminotransferase [Acidobacteriia bacterium]|nr:DegT/DnrJ/EryC1/StrS family aminotransferase [Terriglobia bacterium]